LSTQDEDDKVGTCADGTPCDLCQQREGFCQHHDGDPSTSAGRPPYEPTDKDERIVKSLAMLDRSKVEVAEVIGIDVSTYQKYFGELHDKAAEHAIATVNSAWFEIAASGQHPKATLQWLERKDPESWGPPTQKTDFTSDGEKIEKKPVVMMPDNGKREDDDE